jgi:hypothetical protein
MASRWTTLASSSWKNMSISPYGHPPHFPRKPPVNEDTLKHAELPIERKTFVLVLKENIRGRFLRISEEVGGRRDTIIIPASGLEAFQKLLADMVKAANELPTTK